MKSSLVASEFEKASIIALLFFLNIRGWKKTSGRSSDNLCA